MRGVRGLSQSPARCDLRGPKAALMHMRAWGQLSAGLAFWGRTPCGPPRAELKGHDPRKS